MIENICTITSNLYDKTSKEFKNDPAIIDFFQDSKLLDDFLEEHKRLLLDYIKAYYRNKDEQMKQCQKFYEALSIPYTILLKYINLLKDRLKADLTKDIKNYKEKADIAFEVDQIFSSLINLASQVYIKKECKNTQREVNSKFANFFIFQIHVVWINKIIEAIKDDTLDNFPNVDAKNCDYVKIMNYPESLMVCIDSALCKQLDHLHELFHRKAKLLYMYYKKGEYNEAYFVFKSLMEYSYKFFSLLKELYYITYSDLENSFFKLIELYSYGNKEQTLTLFDINAIRQLNNLYGEGQIDVVLEEIKKTAESVIKENQQNSLIIKGVSANFYILHVDTPHDKVKSDITRMHDAVKQQIAKKFPHIFIEFTIASFVLDKDVKYQKDELVRIMLYLKKEAKREHKWEFIYRQERKEKLRKWLNDRYFNINYIKNKIKNKQIDVMFQPIFTADDKRIFAVEALARIVDGKKLFPAGMYIDTIYEIGLVTQLDILVLDAILTKKDYILDKGLKVFINAAAESLGDKAYLMHLHKFLENFSVENIIIEITEQQALEGLEIIKTIHQKYGVKFAIDDFGSGYSALKTVSDLAEEGLISILKIDGSLVQNLDKEVQIQKIVQVVTRMCEIFGIYSLAEFVENQESLNLLKQYRTGLVQGYHLSKPLRLEELQKIL